MKDQPESYIPLPPGHRAADILRKVIEGPTWEEREAARRLVEQDEARLARQVAECLIRHEQLVAMHQETSIIDQLLQEHEPTHRHRPPDGCHVACRTCDDDTVSWPCPTWTTISDNSPKENQP